MQGNLKLTAYENFTVTKVAWLFIYGKDNNYVPERRSLMKLYLRRTLVRSRHCEARSNLHLCMPYLHPHKCKRLFNKFLFCFFRKNTH